MNKLSRLWGNLHFPSEKKSMIQTGLKESLSPVFIEGIQWPDDVIL